MILRPYQKRVVDKIISSDSGKFIIELPTGAGKSVIIQKLVEKYCSMGMMCAVVVNKSALIPQLKGNLLSTGLSVGVIKAGQHVDVDNQNVILIMEQSLRSSHKIKADVLIRDEVHDGYNGKRFNSVVEMVSPDVFIGLTATPISESGSYLFDDSYEYICGATTLGLIQDGYLSAVDYVVPKYSELLDYSTLRSSGSDYSVSSVDMLINTERHNTFVVKQIVENIYRDDGSMKPTMVFASSIEHAKAINRTLLATGIRSGVVHSKDESNSDAVVKAFKMGRLDVIVNMSKLTTGFDHPAVEMIVLCRPTKVLRLYLQIVGRGLRLSEGKKKCIVLDLCKSLSTHGLVDTVFDFENMTGKEYTGEDGVRDMVDRGPITRDKILNYNLKMKTKRVDELLHENEILTMKLQSSEKSVEEYALKIAKMEQSAKMSRAETMLRKANKYIKKHKLEGACNEDTIQAVLEDFNKSIRSENDKLNTMKNKLQKIIDGENGYKTFNGYESYNGISSMKTLFTWIDQQKKEITA